ncbi:MAG: helix-turn-helix transcriptional regulator [Myxococcus sp.]|nr:helix-turn-helix transcriptional regulator [Myxococcus sp.]
MGQTQHFIEVFDERAFTGRGRLAYVGQSFMFWQDGARALGTVMWGRPLEADVEQMIPFFEVGGAARFRGHCSFVDGRRLESIDLLAFGKLLAYLTKRRHVWGPNVGRQAILHPSGFVGVVVAGALQVARPPYPFKNFENDSRAAFAWCGLRGLHAAYDAKVDAVCAVPPVVRAVRALLQRAQAPLKTSELASRLGVSERSLQRRLAEAGTSLRGEQERHQLRAVEQLLSGTDLTLDAIAALTGFHSASHLARRFKQRCAQTPGAWRARHRETK